MIVLPKLLLHDCEKKRHSFEYLVFAIDLNREILKIDMNHTGISRTDFLQMLLEIPTNVLFLEEESVPRHQGI